MILTMFRCLIEIISYESNYGDEMNAPPTINVHMRGFATEQQVTTDPGGTETQRVGR